MLRIRNALPYGPLLLPALLASAEAQTPRSDRTTSSIPTLFPPDTAVTPPKTGATRQLVCRGDPGLQIAIQQDPSPRSSAYVAVSLTYRPNPGPGGMANDQIEPGACSWKPLVNTSAPVEPGVVHFDLNRQGAANIPDPARMSQWLRDPRHYWVFFVDDVTNVSISHGSYGGTFNVPTLEDPKPAAPTATRVRERLRCRGGPGLAFVRGERKAPNLFGMTLSYAAAPTAAGPIGKGLQPGSCAWADRAGAEKEPGRIKFTTARNAQREQATVDSSATAAERWPDLRTIPAYMMDPAHYWTFTVKLADPHLAVRHNAWNPTVPENDTPPPSDPVATTPTTPTTPPADDPYTSGSPRESSTGRSYPGGSTTGDRYTPGSPSTTTDQVGIFDIRNMQVTSGLEGVAIRFEAAPNLSPTVMVHTAAPTGASGSFRFEGQPVRLVVQGTATGGTHWRYSAASSTPLARGTQYWFIADAPEGPQSRANQTTGEFRTLAQHVKIGISDVIVVSDGDSDSPGDMWFRVQSCPKNLIDGDIAGSMSTRVQWSEGRHKMGHELVSSGTSVPDRLQVFIVGIDDDEHLLSSYGSSHPFWAWFFCYEAAAGTLEPRATSKAEWNAAVLDLDLRQYTGANATQTFIKRSQPLRDGSKVAFDVYGYVTVTRE